MNTTKIKWNNGYSDGVEDETEMEELTHAQKREKLITDLQFQIDCHNLEISKLEKAIEEAWGKR